MLTGKRRTWRQFSFCCGTPSWRVRSDLSYSIIEDGKVAAGGSGYFRGDRAPQLAVEAANLRGEIREETIHSDVLGESRYLTIYLPPTRSRDLSMLVMADGQSCREFARVAEPLILAGKVCPFAAITGVHAATNAQAAGSYDPAKDRCAQEYLRFEDPVIAERYLRFVIEEVIPWATQRFHLASFRSDRAVVGFSNGGRSLSTQRLPMEDGFRHPGLGKFQAADIADVDILVVPDDSSGELVQRIPAAACRLAM